MHRKNILQLEKGGAAAPMLGGLPPPERPAPNFFLFLTYFSEARGCVLGSILGPFGAHLGHIVARKPYLLDTPAAHDLIYRSGPYMYVALWALAAVSMACLELAGMSEYPAREIATCRIL